jgi:hypothetical protein
MKRETAVDINALMLEYGSKLDSSLNEMKSSASADDFKRYRETVAKLMEIMLFEVMNPIYKEYPDLRPKKLT